MAMPPVLVPLVRRGLRGPSGQHGACTCRRAVRRGCGRTGEATQVQGRRLRLAGRDLRAEGALLLAPLVGEGVRVGTGLGSGSGLGLGLWVDDKAILLCMCAVATGLQL